MVEEKKQTLPKCIILLRHSDKPKKDEYGCSKRGLARANYLAKYFLTENKYFTKPDVIYAFRKNGRPDVLLNRSVQTVTPLYYAGQYKPEQLITLYDNTEKETSKMLEDMFHPKNAGKVILCCWEHKMLPVIVKHIGKIIDKPFKEFVSWNMKPKKADDSTLFNMSVIIDIENKSLIGLEQSDKFSDDESYLYDSPIKELFKM